MSASIHGNIVTPIEVIRNATLIVGDDGNISRIVRPETPASSTGQGHLIVPGFIDIHVHGAGGADFMDAASESVRLVARTHARFGTTRLLATTLTAGRDQILRCIDAVRVVMDDPREDEAEITGIHLEGPYICPAKRGAQPLEPIRAPDWDEMRAWIDESGGMIRLITLAPEIDGAIEFIRNAVAAGVIVSIGHTNATYDQALTAIDAGASHGTHLFNAMPPLGHRAPGAVGAVIAAEDVYVELIGDGVHLHPAIIRIAVRAKGVDRVILITDAISGADMPDGDYALGGQRLRVCNGTAKFDDGTLAGSVLTMNRAFINIQRFAGVTAPEASAMSSANAAIRLGLGSTAGRIEVGMRADLTVIDPESGQVEATMRGGRWAWQA